jgi:hypothetical protein
MTCKLELDSSRINVQYFMIVDVRFKQKAMSQREIFIRLCDWQRKLQSNFNDTYFFLFIIICLFHLLHVLFDIDIDLA